MKIEMHLPKFDGIELEPGIILIGEPTPIENTNLMRCLANVSGTLALVELRVKFGLRK